MSTPLLLATLVLLLAFGVPRLVPRLGVWGRASWRVIVLVVFTLALERVLGSPVHPEFGAAPAWERLWQQGLAAGWWLVAAQLASDAARLVLAPRSRSRETRILSDLIGACLYAATGLAVVDIVFAVPIGGLIATSGVIAVVIGLALQSTLSDVFSGIAIDIERPYRAGDLLWIEGGIEGRVQEVNWRSTLVVTGHGDIAIVPNSVMAKARLVNHSLPVPMARAVAEVRLDPRVMPDRCRAALDAAVRACLLPLRDPAPTVSLAALQGDGAVYEIAFSVPGPETLAEARSELLAQVQRHLFHAGIPLAVGGVPDMPHLPVPGAEELLARSSILGELAAEDRELLARGMAEVAFEEGAVLFAQGNVAEALHLVLSGTVGIVRRRPDGPDVELRMSPGSCLGLVGLVTGSPFGATATALTPVRAYRLDRAGLAEALRTRPELAASLEGLARRTRLAFSQDAGADEGPRTEAPDMLLKRMRAFLRAMVNEAGLGLRAV